LLQSNGCPIKRFQSLYSKTFKIITLYSKTFNINLSAMLKTMHV